MAKTPNQFIKPLTTKVNAAGHLEIGGCDVVRLAEEFGTPLYVYDESAIRAMCRAYREALSAYAGESQPLFASKAFCNAAVYKILDSEGFGLDCVSGGELYTARLAGFPASKILFNGNNKSEEEIKFALDMGIGRFSVDNFDELELLARQNKSTDILLRVSPGIECHTHDFIKTGQTDSKFGFNIEEVADAVTRIRKEFPHLNLKGFHAHIGSQIFAPESYFETGIRMIEIIADIAKQTGFMATELDLGGGVGVAYNSGDNPPSVYEAMEQLIAGVNHGCERHNIPHPLIYVEPGRSLVANAGVTLYKVGTFKNVPGIRTYMAIDGGMGDNPRPAMYGAEYTFAAANKMTEPTMEKYTIAGRYCESGDILSKDIVLPKMSAGDILAAFATGAYNAAMFLDYNRVGKPAIVLASDGKAEIISRRHTYEDLAQYDQIPERLK